MLTKNSFLVVVSLTAIVLIMVNGALAQGSQYDIVDRAGFRRPTADVLELEPGLRGAVETRQSFGLNADIDYVQQLRNSSEDVGSERYGYPLTQDELKELETRFAFAGVAQQELLPFVEKLPAFGGAFFNHQANGDLVILLTELDSQVVSQINSMAPDGGNVTIELVQFTQVQLRDNLAKANELWTTANGPTVYATAVDTPANAIRVEVDEAMLAAAETLATEISNKLGIPIFVWVGQPVQNVACTDRDHCTSPMKAGISIRKGSISGNRCTMGFHILVGSDTQFLTAGHCGFTSSWYHTGYGKLGTPIKTQWANNGRDIMTVQVNDAQGSNKIYDGQPLITLTGVPWIGMPVCASAAVSNAILCGSVQDDYLTWSDGTYTGIQGGDSSMTFIGGDSGSPIYGSAYPLDTAVGIVNGAAGQFAIVRDALSYWGYSIRNY